MSSDEALSMSDGMDKTTSNNKDLLSLQLAFFLFFISYSVFFVGILAWPFVDSMDRLASLEV